MSLLARISPGDAVLERLPVVDPLGQYVRDSNQPATLEELKAAWQEEERTLVPGEYGYCP